MFNIGSQELLVILLLVFLLFGPRHIPEVARVLGKGLGDVQRAMRGVEDNMRRAAHEMPKMVDDGNVPPAPRVLPAAGAIERKTAPDPGTPAPPSRGSFPIAQPDRTNDAIKDRSDAEA